MNEQLAAIKARREAATPGVWTLVEMGRDYAVFAPHPVESGNTCIAVIDGGLSMDSKRDGAFIAAAPADIDTLLAHVTALTAERDALAQQLQQAQDAAKRQAAYISECVDSDGCYRP